jgi:hypothetical protein
MSRLALIWFAYGSLEFICSAPAYELAEETIDRDGTPYQRTYNEEKLL